MISHLEGMAVRTKIWLEKDGKPVFGTGKAGLFRAIMKEGSISGASKRVHISFRRAWSHLDNTERNFGTPLLLKHKGGKGGGSSVLTDEAGELVKKFERLNEDVAEYARGRFEELFYAE